MQPLEASAAALVAARRGLVLATLVWVSARNRASGGVETMGMWTGDSDLTIAVDGQQRLYYAMGGLVEVEPITAAAGLEVRELQLTLAPLAPDVEMLVRGYEPRNAPVEVHRLLIDPASGQPAGGPARRWAGRVDVIEIVSAGEDEPGRITLRSVSAAIDGTKGLTARKSDESGKLRKLPGGAPDRFWRYADISGKAPIKWGEDW